MTFESLCRGIEYMRMLYVKAPHVYAFEGHIYFDVDDQPTSVDDARELELYGFVLQTHRYFSHPVWVWTGRGT